MQKPVAHLSSLNSDPDEKSVDHIVDQTSGFECRKLASAVTEETEERRIENDQKPLPQQELVILCLALASDDLCSGSALRDLGAAKSSSPINK